MASLFCQSNKRGLSPRLHPKVALLNYLEVVEVIKPLACSLPPSHLPEQIFWYIFTNVEHKGNYTAVAWGCWLEGDSCVLIH